MTTTPGEPLRPGGAPGLPDVPVPAQRPAADAGRARQHPCSGCGAGLEYSPGTTAMVCPYCGGRQELTPPGPAARRRPWDGSPPTTRVADVAPLALDCAGCGATTSTTDLAGPCPFCAAPTVLEADRGGLLHRPDAVLPCRLDRREAAQRFQEWVSSRWFAPAVLQRVAATETLQGTYLPHWTFDTSTTSTYTGQRGDHYWVTVTDTRTVDGKQVTTTRQERRTRWRRASGTVARDFTDVLAPATTALPRTQLDRLGPWDLPAARAYAPAYLAGFRVPRYDVDVDVGFDDARAQMTPVIEKDCRRDIGGDEQRVSSVDTRYADLAFGMVLLPVWVGSYLLHGESFCVLVNASTGEVVGDRPYSKLKIAAAVLAVALLVALLSLAYAAYGGGSPV
jgi:hypothetical protein